MDKVEQIIADSNHHLIEAGGKSSVGFLGAIGAMTINDMVGLVVGLLTAVYMCFQIESVWRKRKADIKLARAAEQVEQEKQDG